MEREFTTQKCVNEYFELAKQGKWTEAAVWFSFWIKKRYCSKLKLKTKTAN